MQTVGSHGRPGLPEHRVLAQGAVTRAGCIAQNPVKMKFCFLARFLHQNEVQASLLIFQSIQSCSFYSVALKTDTDRRRVDCETWEARGVQIGHHKARTLPYRGVMSSPDFFYLFFLSPSTFIYINGSPYLTLSFSLFPYTFISSLESTCRRFVMWVSR